jgi:phospholipid/cholesterol/gamma-HCH transport system permease protein
MSDTSLSRNFLFHQPRRLVARLGALTRRRAHFSLVLAALTFGVVWESLKPSTWRRTVRVIFVYSLRQAVVGSLVTILVTAALVGIGLVNQALFWLGEAGQEKLIGSVLDRGLIRGIGPALVGMILLGRGGMLAIAEIGDLRIGGQIRALEAQGIDPFLVLVLPRAVAMSLASFTLTVLFIAVALLTGYLADNFLQQASVSFGAFLDAVLKSMVVGDFIVFPIKTLTIGLLVTMAAVATALEARPRESTADLLPRGFVRGVLLIVFVNVSLTIVV